MGSSSNEKLLLKAEYLFFNNKINVLHCVFGRQDRKKKPPLNRLCLAFPFQIWTNNIVDVMFTFIFLQLLETAIIVNFKDIFYLSINFVVLIVFYAI